MSLDEFTQYVSWCLYLLIFAITLVRAVRHPVRANIDIALLFSVPTLILGLTLALSFDLLQPTGITNAVMTTLVLLLVYMLLRLVDDFSYVRPQVKYAWEAALVLLIVSAFVFMPGEPTWLTLVQIIYIVSLLLYTIVAFVKEAQKTRGVTIRRMRAIAMGSVWLCMIFFIAGLSVLFPDNQALFRPLTDFAFVASGLSYFLGFATPTILRRSWQEPELRAFLGRAASLPRLPDTEAIMAELERGAARSLGAGNAKIVLWDEDAQKLWFTRDGETLDVDMQTTITARCFLTQKPIFTDNLIRDNPTLGEQARRLGAVTLMVAPITAGEKRIGVLTLYAPHSPIFADEDLQLVQLLADQAAVILESRALIDEAARVQAREEATRMKDDFLSAAAHDLKTPLTTLVMQSDILERRAMRSPEAPADLEGLRRMKKEVHRLKDFVLELLDATRAEQGKLVGMKEEVDLVACAEEVCARHNSEHHHCQVRAHGPVWGQYDPIRINQLLDNLVENAVKYSPEGGSVRVRLWRGGLDVPGVLTESKRHDLDTGAPGAAEWNHITVTDNGIGIPRQDLPRLFDRFHRGSNVDDRRFAGIGLGLFICKAIVDQHGGEILVTDGMHDEAGSQEQAVSRPSTTGGITHGTDSISASRRGVTEAAHTTGGRAAHDNQAFAEAYGGNNGQSDRKGRIQGTTFHVVLPVTPPVATTATTPLGDTTK